MMKVGSKWAIPLAAVVGLGVGALAVSAATPSPTGQSPAAVFVDKLAGILHRTPSQTQADLKQAQLQTIDQLVKDGKLTPAQADAMKKRVEAGNGLALVAPFGRHPGSTDRTLFKNLGTAQLDAVARTLKLSTSDLKSQLRSGKKLSELEAAAGVTDATVRSAAENAAKSVLDAAVKAKTITQAQADTYLKRLQQSPRGVPFGGRFGGQHGFRGSPPAVGASPAPSG
jgi:hypothetical protein